jgi:hypothetical protein
VRLANEPHAAPALPPRKLLPKGPGPQNVIPVLFLTLSMALLLRKSSAQARIEGWESCNWPDDDYAVVEDTIVGRIYREMILGKPKWRWFLRQIPEAGLGRPIPPPNQGMADTLDEAKAAFAKRYEEVSGGMMDRGSGWHRFLANAASAGSDAGHWSCWPAALTASTRRCCSLMGSPDRC